VEGVFDGAAGVEEATTVGEGVRGDIDDAHDEGAGADGVGGAVDEPGIWHCGFRIGDCGFWNEHSGEGGLGGVERQLEFFGFVIRLGL
jgi:hypothetical protein